MTSKDDIFSWSLISLMYLLNVIYIICMTSTQVQTNWLARVWRIMRNNQTCKCLFATIPKIWGVTRQPVMTICCIRSTVFPPGSYEGVHRPINAFEHPHYLCFYVKLRRRGWFYGPHFWNVQVHNTHSLVV